MAIMPAPLTSIGVHRDLPRPGAQEHGHGVSAYGCVVPDGVSLRRDGLGTLLKMQEDGLIDGIKVCGGSRLGEEGETRKHPRG
jgi:hypothetical protein